MDLSWALVLPQASDLDWNFEAGDFQHMTEVEENSSAAGLDVDEEAHHGMADLPSYLDPLDPDLASPAMETSRIHRPSESWDPVINSASPLESPGARSGFIPSTRNFHGSRTHISPTDAFAVPTLTSESSTSGNLPASKITPTRTGSGNGVPGTPGSCQCISIMLNMLENNGVQGPGKDPRDAEVGLDDIFSSLARGTNSIEEVLRCGQCNACTENGMLLTTITRQICDTVVSVTTAFPSQERPHDSVDRTNRGPDHRLNNRGSQGPQLSGAGMMEFSKSTIDSPINNSPTRKISNLLEGSICFGHYKVHNPEIRAQIVHHALFLHISQLREILVRVKDKLGSHRGAWKALAGEEVRVEKLWNVFHSKITHQE
ncbi:hypothetical protein DHEL01_v212333 [Diaporthe helianthi]|uniref:Aflatoxin regulatory protein domain-containing protein n=1 Tax=Diaporthe helianthi TaxID=158607 RepID=A0A2P5HGA1_DIAHE|nr:hypothetical protein DHEL01_v212333 [Diaporthe helianthi]